MQNVALNIRVYVQWWTGGYWFTITDASLFGIWLNEITQFPLKLSTSLLRVLLDVIFWTDCIELTAAKILSDVFKSRIQLDNKSMRGWTIFVFAFQWKGRNSTFKRTAVLFFHLERAPNETNVHHNVNKVWHLKWILQQNHVNWQLAGTLPLIAAVGTTDIGALLQGAKKRQLNVTTDSRFKIK